MSWTATNVTSGGSSTGASSYVTASASLSADKLYLLTVRQDKGSTGATTPTVSGASQTWTKIASHAYSGNTRRRTTIFRCMPTGSASGTLTIDFSSETQNNCDWILDEIDGAIHGNNGADAIVQHVASEDTGSNSSFSLSLGTFDKSENATYGAVHAGNAASSITEGSSFTEEAEVSTGGGGYLETEFQNANDTSVDWTYGASANTFGGFALELAAIVDATGTAALSIPAPDIAANGLGNDNRIVLIDGTDYTSNVRFDSFSLTEAANRGEVGTGGFDVKDLSSALDIPALKVIMVSEPSASDDRLFTGFIHDRTIEPMLDQAQAARNWAVETTDLNVLASDYVLTDAEGANRPSETDYQRIIWLLTTAMHTSGGVSNGIVPNSNTVTMEATDYRGRYPADVLAECSEAAGKLWFIYDYGQGHKIYYDLATGTSLTSSASISDAGDADGSTIWAPVGAPSLKSSPDRIYSKVHLTYNSGTVTVENTDTRDNFRPREVAILDTSITDSALATTKANALLAGAASEVYEVDGVTLVLPAANVNDIRAGQRVQMKLIRQKITSYTYYRIIRRTIAPTENVDYYQVELGLASDVLASANGSRGGDAVWQNKSNATDDGATVITDGGGITITDGALTLTDEFASTVLSSSGFAGSWSDFIRLGLYNARFTQGSVGSLTMGRTSDLPYWDLVQAKGSPTATLLSGGGVEFGFSALNDWITMSSDQVAVRPGSVLEAGYAYECARSAGTIRSTGFVSWYQADGSPSAISSYDSFGNVLNTASVSDLLWMTDSLAVPEDAVAALLEVTVEETGTHNASNTLTVYCAKLADQFTVQPRGWALGELTTHYVTLDSTPLDDLDPGDIDSAVLYQFYFTADTVIRGIVAPSRRRRLIYIQNYTNGYTLTLRHENSNSSAANRFSLPGNTGYVLSNFGSVCLYYDNLQSRWVVLDT